MMEPLDSPARLRHGTSPLNDSPTRPTGDVSSEGPNLPSRVERDMLFFRRPDLSGRQIFFETDGGRNQRRSTEATPPVQLVGLDGQMLIGMPVGSMVSRSYNEVTVAGSGADPIRREGRLSRMIVTSDSLSERSTRRRIRSAQILFVSTAVGSFLLTVSLLFPSDSEGWFYVDGLESVEGIRQSKRVSSNYVFLLTLSLMTNSAGVIAVSMKSEKLLTAHIYATIASDVCALTLLLPHAFFLLRYLFDVLVVVSAANVRSYLTKPWFVTNFHRLRY